MNILMKIISSKVSLLIVIEEKMKMEKEMRNAKK